MCISPVIPLDELWGDGRIFNGRKYIKSWAHVIRSALCVTCAFN